MMWHAQKGQPGAGDGDSSPRREEGWIGDRCWASPSRRKYLRVLADIVLTRNEPSYLDQPG
jgi:hypothetical protein